MHSDVVSLGGNLALVDELYGRFLDNPESVEPEWRALFEDGTMPAPPVEERSERGEVGSVWPLVNAYRARGHLKAELDPLGLLNREPPIELDPARYGFDESDAERLFDTVGLQGLPERAPLRSIIEMLERTYCGTIGLEFLHVGTPNKKEWLRRHMESLALSPELDAEVRRGMLDKLIAAESFERFIHTKYPGTKRFSIEGAESLIPMLEESIEHFARSGVIEVVVGMAHRGRLNVLVQTMGRQARDLFSEFDDVEPESTLGAGDVKYHLGYSCDRKTREGHTVHVSLAYNPSHLEAVDPVVVGRVRGKQRRHGDWQRRRTAGVLIHGDAAFAGQGLVAETLQLSNLHGYRTGGTLHLVVNNQIGFTATAAEYRSTPYCTDIAKMIQCPIWHVNGEDLDAVARVVGMAIDYRDRFQSDVVIDMLCYRKFGHNEMDEPSFTQPIMYRRIQQKQDIASLYAAKLIEEDVLTSSDVEGMRSHWRDHYESELSTARERGKRPQNPAMGGYWSPFVGGREADVEDVETCVPRARLEAIAERISGAPENITLHPKIAKLLEQRAKMGKGELPIDWGMGEMLAYGSLLWEGYNVRMSGQDSVRGTFSHRHAMVVDVDTGTEYMLLGHLHSDQGDCRIYDSPLSEAGVLGFEFGYSLDYPEGLAIWEAQFGDFANGAQVIIDQFIVSSEDKWDRLSGIVLLLPHGFEGQGPEHSSARIERFLQMCAEDNIQVVQPSTPAQMFHLLRRQVVRPYRKPLIVASPKSLLRHPRATSSIEELSKGAFERVIGDPDVDPAKVRRLFLCSGRVAYDLFAEREKRGDKSTAILRIEQLYPWREEALRAAVKPFERIEEAVWIQDEPRNMGPLVFVVPRIEAALGGLKVREVSRPASASPATGSSKAHAIEERSLMNQAFGSTEAAD